MPGSSNQQESGNTKARQLHERTVATAVINCAARAPFGYARKDGKYSQRTLWYKILNTTYTQKTGRQEFFQRQ